MNDNTGKFHITACTLVIPLHGKQIGQFCNWYQTDHVGPFSGKPSYLNVKFTGKAQRWMGPVHMLHTDRKEPQFTESEFFSQFDQDFVQVAIRKDDFYTIWELAITQSTLEKIWANSEAGRHIQLFDFSFDSVIQRDPNIVIATCEEVNSGLLLQSECSILGACATIEKCRSIPLSEYQEMTGHDAVLHYPCMLYYDAILGHRFRDDFTFDEFVDRERSRFVQA